MENSKWDQILIKCIRKNWTNLTKEEKRKLSARRNALNRNFLFTDDNIGKLRKLNDILHKRETVIHAHANRLRKIQKEWVGNKWIDEYELECTMMLWNSKLDILDPEFEGNPFHESSLIHFGNTDNDVDEVFFTDNWNEFAHSPDHPLSKEFHCYTFHHIYDHTVLSWSDIVEIDQVWIEIEVRNQFLIDIV